MVVIANWLTWCQGCLREVFFLREVLFLLSNAELFSIVENNLYGNAYDSTLVAVVPSPGERVAVSESMNRDLNRVNVWCNLCGMKLNESNTKRMIVSRSRTVHPLLTPLTLD